MQEKMHALEYEDMKRTLLFIFIFALLSAILYADGVGLYRPDRDNYTTKDGSDYIVDNEYNGASSIYTIGSILKLSDGEKSADIYINDEREMTPDRTILLNEKAASLFDIQNSGYENLEVSVILPGNDMKNDEAWVKFKAQSFNDNASAAALYNEISSRGLRPFLTLEDGKIDVYVRYVPRHQAEDVEEILTSIGCVDIADMSEENPYL